MVLFDFVGSAGSQDGRAFNLFFSQLFMNDLKPLAVTEMEGKRKTYLQKNRSLPFASTTRALTERCV